MMKKTGIALATLLIISSVVCQDESCGYVLHDLSADRIAQHEETIAQRELQFTLVRNGIKIGSAALMIVGMISLYRWANSGVLVPEADVAAMHTDIKNHSDVLAQILANTEKYQVAQSAQATGVLEKMQEQEATIRKLQMHNNTLVADAQKPFFAGIPGGFVMWLKYIINNSIIGTAVATGAYVIAQHGLPAIFSCLDKVFYTFSYHWFVKHRTQMVSCFEELERAAYVYDNHLDQRTYQRRIFIWSFNQLLAECEYTIAFMQVQNKALLPYSFAHARHMAVITKHFRQVIEKHKEALGDLSSVPQGWATMTEFVKGFRDRLRTEGESYAQNEQYMFSRIRGETATA